jgi:hypothetical protein
MCSQAANVSLKELADSVYVMGWLEVADNALSDCFSCQYVKYQ